MKWLEKSSPESMSKYESKIYTTMKINFQENIHVLNENNKVVYKEIVSEGTNYPDFEAALKAYRNI